jgi:hypothetical protein
VLYTVVFVLPAGLYTLLRSPWVQNFLTHRAAEYLSHELKTKVSIGGINVAFFLDLVLEDVQILDQHGNTMLYADEIIADVNNIAYSDRKIMLGRISVDNAFIALMKYKNEKALNLQFIIDYFTPKDTVVKEPSPPWKVEVTSLALIHTRFVYNDQNVKRPKRGMDYGGIDVSNINLLADKISIYDETFYARILYLTAKERCGFILNSFNAYVAVSPHELIANSTHIKTPNSELDLDLKFAYDSWDDYNHFEEKVLMTGNIRKSLLNMKDIGYFAPELEDYNEKLLIEGQVLGKVGDLKASELKIHYGRKTYFYGNIRMKGLPDIKKTDIKVGIKYFSTHYSDIANLYTPDGKGNFSKIEMPPELKALGNIWLTGNFTGRYYDFLADAHLTSDLGSLQANVHMMGNPEVGLQSYSGHVIAYDFNIGAMISSTDLVGAISMDGDISGSGFTKETANLTIKGNVSSFGFKQYQYKNITVNGDLRKRVFNGTLIINDPNLDMDFVGYVDYSDSIPVFDFTSDVIIARLNHLNLLKSDSITDVSCKLQTHFVGTNADNIAGTFTLENASYKDGSQVYDLRYLKVTAITGLYNFRTFYVKSDYVDAEFKGTFYFKDLIFSVKRYIASYLPGIKFPNDSLNKVIKNQDFSFNITFYNATPVLKYFISEVTVSPNTTLNGNFSSTENKLNFNFNSKEFTYKKIKFDNIYSNAVTKGKSIDINSGCDRVLLTDSTHIDNMSLISHVNNDSIRYNLSWDNSHETIHNAASIMGYLTFCADHSMHIGISPSWFTINDTTWNVYSSSDVIIDSGNAEVPGIYLTSKEQKLQIEGSISKLPGKKITAKLMNFNLSNFDYITDKLDFDVDGIIDGYIDVFALLGKPTYFSDIQIKGLGFNGGLLGDAVIKSNWDDVNQGIRINADVLYVGVSETAKPVKIDGYFFPESKKNNFDLNIIVENFQLKSLSRYLAGTATIISGAASGSFTLRGLTSDPEIKGKANIMRTCFKIDYLNTIYGCAHDNIRLDKNGIYFENLVLLDQPYGDTAICSGKILHHKFKEWKFDITMLPKKFLCLNTSASQNELFYGKAFATGYAHIMGDEKNVQIDLDVKTERNTQLFIPMEYTSEVSENNYITFVKHEGDTIKVEGKDNPKITGVTLNCNFQVTDDAEVQIIFDPSVGDRIRGRGNGNINMEISSDGKFQMSGDYTVKSGDYLFTFENVLNKRFNIVEGGTISWDGDPYDAELNLKAVYRLKASLASLGIDTTKNNVPVECIINMTGPLINPLFSFEVDLPSMSDVEKSPYMSVINQNLNYNFLTLLVVNSFYNPGVAIGGNNSQVAGNASLLGKTSSEVLSNQMSNWLSQISKDVDIGINYRPGDQITQQEVEVALSTQLLHDRIRIESNLGIGGGLANSQTKNSNNIVGDVNVEIKITDQTKLRVFNKSNQQDYLANDAPYTQGVGVFYKHEFNSFKDLFKKKKKKEKKSSK